MRHRVSGRKLGRTSSHRTAMLRNMATSLFLHERIETTVQKAKELRPFAEKLITLAKKETLHARRLVLRDIQNKDVVAKLFDTIGVRFATRPGGYTRIIKTHFRRGDNAEMAIIELLDGAVSAAAPKKAAPAKKAATKTEDVAEEKVEAAEEAAETEAEATEEKVEAAAEEAPAEEAAPEEAPAEAEAEEKKE